MRLPASGGVDAASETIAAAAKAGITVFDTAHAYGDGATYGQNERLLSRALRACGAERRARIVTKGGMTRVANAWIPDGRAKAIRGDCEFSLAALDGLPIDLYLLHAPDPRTPWPTSVRALARLLDEGLVAHLGLSNVNHHQLQQALDMVEVTAIEVALSVVDDRAVRGGLIDFCAERGIAVIAHSPLGGPRRVRAVAHRPELVEIARARDASPEQVALAWLLELSSVVVPIPGARRPETAVSAAQAAQVRLEPGDRALLISALKWPHAAPARPSSPAVDDGEVVLIMGVPGAGKSCRAEQFVAQGYVRLNRDERGGSLRQLSDVLEQSLAAGARRIVLDNTYLTRALRSHVVGSAARHGIGVRCIWIDTPLAQAQVNLVERLLVRFGSLPDPRQLQEHARVEPGLLSPTRQMRAFRELEPPSRDEGFVSVERVRFERSPRAAARSERNAGSRVRGRCGANGSGLGTRTCVRRCRRSSPRLRLETGRGRGRARRGRCASCGDCQRLGDRRALPSWGWSTGVLVPSTVARARPGIRAHPRYRSVALAARRRSTRASHARHHAWRHVSRGE